MENKIKLWATLIGMLIGSLYFFNTNASTPIMGMSVYQLFCAVGFIGTFLLMLRFPAHPAILSLFLTLGVEMTLITAIFSDIIQDPTSHNLFPFEVIASAMVTLLSAFTGAYLAELIKYLKKNVASKGRKSD